MLDGVRVVELGQNLAGPFASSILADLGAQVIKVEKPGGEDGRKLGPPFVGADPAWFHQVNRNKQSIVVDLTDPADHATLVELIGASDVFVHNARPDVLVRYGLDAATLRGRFPTLIHASIGAFGRLGPKSQLPGYELLMQAYGGLMTITGGEDAPPTRAGPSIVDLGTGVWTALGILAALVRRGATGAGCTVDSSLLETALGYSAAHIVNYLASGQVAPRTANGFAGLAPYGAYPTRDAQIIVGGGNDSLFRKLAGVLGHPEWLTDPRFASNSARVAHKSVLDGLVRDVLVADDASAWLARLQAAGIPCAPIHTIPEVVDDPQTVALGMIDRAPDPHSPNYVGLPLSFDGVRPGVRTATPHAGEHDAVVRSRLRSGSGPIGTGD